MTIDPKLFAQLIVTFKDELEEQLQLITNGLLSLEEKTENDMDKVVESLFRAAHNIKGTSRSLGINDIGMIAHGLENLFSTVKNNQELINLTVIDLSLEAVDKIQEAMRCFLEKSTLSFDLTEFLKKLNQKLGKEGVSKSQTAAKTITQSVGKGSAKNESDLSSEIKVQEKKKLGQQQKTKDEKDQLASGVSDSAGQETIRVNLNQLDRISALMDEMQLNRIAIDDLSSDLIKVDAKASQTDPLWKELSLILDNALTKYYGENERKVNNLYKTSMHDIISKLDKISKHLHTKLSEVRILSNTLQDEMRMLRLIPASHLLQAMPRAVRDIAHELGKDVELKIFGDEVKIDKAVLDKLKDPLIHILRNAIDHGIESKEIRCKKNKPEKGTIKIHVKEEAGQILFDISDDGIGIDCNSIARIAEKNQFFSSADLEKMSESEILQIIFRPGFSTREIITDVSGRGVGLDVVQSNLTELKGLISVDTVVNEGTIFHLRVPLSLAGERGLIINAGGQMFAIPISVVERVLTVSIDEVFEAEGSQAILLDDHPVPLRSLVDLLGLKKASVKNVDKMSIVVVKKGWSLVAFLVDEIIAERDIVIKPLQGPFSSTSCVSGGTLSGTGAVIIVLNPADLVDRALQTQELSLVNLNAEQESVITNPRILVVDDSITTRTLEKNILESKGYDVTVAVDGRQAWDILQKHDFSLLITDITMPNMDGFTLTEHVKSNERLHNMPVIIITSLDSDAEKKRGIEVGADAYIIKSAFESGSLLQIVTQLV